MSSDSETARDFDSPPAQTMIPPAGSSDSHWKTIEYQLTEQHKSAVHNFAGDKTAQYRLTSLACGPLCEKFDRMPEAGIDLHYFYCHLVEMTAEKTGEITTAIRSVLIDKDGKAYGFVSQSIPNELDRLISFFGVGPWFVPMRVKVKNSKTRKGNQIYTMDLA